MTATITINKRSRVMPEPGDNFSSLEGDVPFDVSEAEKVTALAKRYDMSETDIKKFIDEETARVARAAVKHGLPKTTLRAAIRSLKFLNAQSAIRKEVEEAMADEFDLPCGIISALLRDARQLNGGEKDEDEEDEKEREHAVRLAWKHRIPLFQVMSFLKEHSEEKEEEAGVLATLANRYQLPYATVARLLSSARGLKVQLQIQGCMTVPELRIKSRLLSEDIALLEEERRINADIAALLEGERIN